MFTIAKLSIIHNKFTIHYLLDSYYTYGKNKM